MLPIGSSFSQKPTVRLRDSLGDRRDTRPRLTQTMRFATTEERDTTMQYGVEEGAKSGFERVDAVLQRLPLDA
jgi:hypothetical protein